MRIFYWGWQTKSSGYIEGGIYAIFVSILVHITQVPGAITEIFTAAFNPKAATGGIVGSVFVCMRYGIARGIYSNEAGLIRRMLAR